jgi:hypothetical protein
MNRPNWEDPRPCPGCVSKSGAIRNLETEIARLTFERDEALDSCKMWRGIACEQEQRADRQQERAEANFAELSSIRQILELERGALRAANDKHLELSEAHALWVAMAIEHQDRANGLLEICAKLRQRLEMSGEVA